MSVYMQILLDVKVNLEFYAVINLVYFVNDDKKLSMNR